MQFIPALFAGFKTAGATVASALTGGSGFSASAIFSGLATVGGALATLGAAKQQANSYKQQAAETELEATASDTAAIQKQTAMKRELMRVLGENSVTAAAAGIDLGSGLAAQTEQDVKQRAATELSIDRSSQDARRAMFRARAAGLRSMAKSAKRTGAFQAFGSLAGGLADTAERG